MPKKKLDYQLIMRMKYDMKTYAEIAAEAGTSENYIAQMFMTDGRLEVEYAEYKKKMNDALQDEVIEDLRQSVKKAGNAMVMALEHYLLMYKQLEDSLKIEKNPDIIRNTVNSMATVLQKASNQAERVLDRAGMPIVSKSEVKNGDLPTYDDLIKRLNSEGIDPKTGHRGRTGEVLASMGLSN